MQPYIEPPQAFVDAVKRFEQPVLEYAPSPGVPAFIEAVQGYYEKLGISLAAGNIWATTGGSEALQMALACILDEGDEILVPEPFYPNYHNVPRLLGAVPVTDEPSE